MIEEWQNIVNDTVVTREEIDKVSALIAQLPGSVTLHHFARMAGLPEDRLVRVLCACGQYYSSDLTVTNRGA